MLSGVVTDDLTRADRVVPTESSLSDELAGIGDIPHQWTPAVPAGEVPSELAARELMPEAPPSLRQWRLELVPLGVKVGVGDRGGLSGSGWATQQSGGPVTLGCFRTRPVSSG